MTTSPTTATSSSGRPGHLWGVHEAQHCLVEHVARDREQESRIGEGGQHLEAVEPVGMSRIALLAGQLDRGKRHPQPDDIGEQVTRVGEQRERPEQEAAHDLDESVGEGQQEGGEQGATMTPGGRETVRVTLMGV